MAYSSSAVRETPRAAAEQRQQQQQQHHMPPHSLSRSLNYGQTISGGNQSVRSSKDRPAFSSSSSSRRSAATLSRILHSNNNSNHDEGLYLCLFDFLSFLLCRCHLRKSVFVIIIVVAFLLLWTRIIVYFIVFLREGSGSECVCASFFVFPLLWLLQIRD